MAEPLTRQQHEAVANLVTYCEIIASSGKLAEAQERRLRELYTFTSQQCEIPYIYERASA